jgi:hypothetical protein
MNYNFETATSTNLQTNIVVDGFILRETLQYSSSFWIKRESDNPTPFMKLEIHDGTTYNDLITVSQAVSQETVF